MPPSNPFKYSKIDDELCPPSSAMDPGDVSGDDANQLRPLKVDGVGLDGRLGGGGWGVGGVRRWDSKFEKELRRPFESD